MKKEKFQVELATLKKFYEVYCHDKHNEVELRKYVFNYQEEPHTIELMLCDECHKDISYSFEKLLECPHEIKPRCRKCLNPCFDKIQWKNTARVMKYSSIKLSLGKIKSRIMNIFN